MNVSSVKNLNGETFSAVQDATLTNVVQTNSAKWNEISAYENASASFIPYTTSGLELPNSKFKIDTSGQAYKLSKSEITVSGINLESDRAFFPQGTVFNAGTHDLDLGINYNDIYMLYNGYDTKATGTCSNGKATFVLDNAFTAYSDCRVMIRSGYALNEGNGVTLTTEGDVPEEYALKSDIPDTSTFYTTADANTLSSMLSGAIDYVSGQVDNKLETTAFADVSGSFLTAVDLSNYYTKSETSGASEIADALSNIPTGNPEVENYVQTNSANIDDTVTSYQTNSGTFLTAHQAISAEEWNNCYDNVNTNSGVWGGSALPISAGPGIKVNLVDNTLVFSNDETVLWENPNGTMTKDIQWPQTLSEPITNFEKVSFLYGADDYSGNAEYHTFNTYNNFNYNLVAWRCDGPGNNNIFWREAKFNCNGTSLTNPYNSTINLSTAFAGAGFNTTGYNWLLKVIGINRIAGGN